MEVSFLEGPGSFVLIIITLDFSVSCEGYLSKMTVFVWKLEGLIHDVVVLVVHLLFIKLRQVLDSLNS